MSRFALFVALSLAACGGGGPAPTSTVMSAEVIRGSINLVRENTGATEHASCRVETGASVITSDDGRATLTHDRGAWILLDRASTLTAAAEGISIESGRAWIDASSADPTEVRTAQGRLVASGASFAVDVGPGDTRVYVGSGEVTYFASTGTEGQAMQGETLVLSGSGATVEPEALWDDWTGGLADPAGTRLRTREPVGTLKGRAPWELGVARTPLPVRSHEVHVDIQGDLARTEVVQTFFNARSDTLEGIWEIRIPDGTIVESFAVNTGAGFVDGTPQPVQLNGGYALNWMGADYYDSRLSYDGPGRLRARIFPIPNGGTVQIRIRWTEWLARRGNTRTYTYPMRGDGEPPLLGEFMLDVTTSGSGAAAFRAGLGAVDEGGRIALRLSDHRPRADFTLDLIDPDGYAAAPVTAYTVTGNTTPGAVAAEGDERYVLFDLDEGAVEAAIGSVPSSTEPLELVLLVDASGATDPEDLEIARAVVEAVLRQLAPSDRVTLRVADVTAHVPPDGVTDLVVPDEANREAMLASISRIEPSGATDLGESLRAAAAVVAGRPRGAVLYLGDAMPTTGGLDATSLRTTLATIDGPPRFFGFAIGDGANADLLRALFGDGAHAIRDRETAARTVMSVLAEAARPTLRGLYVALGEGVERVFPRGALSLGRGEHLLLVGRQAGEIPTELVVRGTQDGAPFEVTLPVTRGALGAGADGGDIRRRWATARLSELLDEDAGREALVELGTRFGVVTPWTVLHIGSYGIMPVPLVRYFDRDPLAVPWGLGGGGAAVMPPAEDGEGWRRRRAAASTSAFESGAGAEATWAPRVSASDAAAGASAAAPTGDGGLGRAAVARTLEEGERGPRGCYERRAIVRPDLSGSVNVVVTVGGDGAVRGEPAVSSSFGDPEVERCIREEIAGLSYPETGGATPIVATHVYVFRAPERELGSRRTCSDASRESLEARRTLWAERLEQHPGVDGAIQVFREARAACELDSWRAKRALLDLMLDQNGGLYARIQIYQGLRGDAAIRSYLRRAILRAVRSPEDVAFVRSQMGLEPGVEWWVFSRLWARSITPEARLSLVRRWLRVAPEDIDLRLRLLSLLEETGDLAEARRVARELRADPLADARARTEIGEFWLRQREEGEARRVFSEIVEHTPLDPWARRRLGDLYRAHGWSDDAYREYQTLARLRPNEGEVILLLARAAADAGRIDEALRLEQRVSESAEPGLSETSAATSARLWSLVRLSRLRDAEGVDAAAIRRRMRETGALRDPPDAIAILTFEHPDDAPSLAVRWPSADAAGSGEEAGARPFVSPTVGDVRSGILAIRIDEREAGEHVLQIGRSDLESLRDWSCELMVIVHPGTAEERILRQPVTLTRTSRTLRFALSDADALTPAP